MKKLFKKDLGEEHNFWMSYTDLISGFLIVFIILTTIFYNNYSHKITEAEDAKAKYDSIKVELGKANTERDKMVRHIDSLEVNDLKNMIEDIYAVFVYDSEVESTIDLKRGSIILTHRDPDKDLFVQNSQPIMQTALRNYLKKIGRNLVATAIELDKKRGNNGIELRIEGHTDPTWEGSRGTDYGYMRNLELSSGRANAVYKYIFENCDLSPQQKLFAKKNMISIGYSFSERITQRNIDDRNEDSKSRRIEFRIISK